MTKGIRRAVQFHKLLGNSLVYRIVRLLGKHSKLRPGEISVLAGATRTAVSNQLGRLAAVGIVGLKSTGQRPGRKVEYWLADRRIYQSLKTIERRLAAQKR